MMMMMMMVMTMTMTLQWWWASAVSSHEPWALTSLDRWEYSLSLINAHAVWSAFRYQFGSAFGYQLWVPVMRPGSVTSASYECKLWVPVMGLQLWGSKVSNEANRTESLRFVVNPCDSLWIPAIRCDSLRFVVNPCGPLRIRQCPMLWPAGAALPAYPFCCTFSHLPVPWRL